MLLVRQNETSLLRDATSEPPAPGHPRWLVCALEFSQMYFFSCVCTEIQLYKNDKIDIVYAYKWFISLTFVNVVDKKGQ